MTKTANTKIYAIQNHINRNFKRWFKSYSNVEGMEVGLKKTKGEIVKNCYSVIFHVSKKTSRAKHKVPKTFYVTIDSNRKIKVFSDVIETGTLQLHGIKIGDCAQNKKSTVVGTISFYFTSSQGVYLCSNMHVLAPNLLRKGQIHFDARREDTIQSIVFFDKTISSTARLMRARFDGIDIGFARIDNPLIPQIVERIIKTVGPVRGIFDVTVANQKSIRTSFFGSSSALQACSIVSLGAVKATEFENVFLTNLIKLELCTDDGDSGASIFDQKDRLVGIIIGRDTEHSYALHIQDVIKFFQSSKL